MLLMAGKGNRIFVLEVMGIFLHLRAGGLGVVFKLHDVNDG